MDIWDKQTRSLIMAKVPQKNSKPEVIIRKYLFSKGFRYRTNVKNLSGTPDIVLPKYKTAIFVHGCFWHGHTCRAAHLPSSNLSYWNEKIAKNIERDYRKNAELEELGWNIIIIWQCELKNVKLKEQRLSKLENEIKLNS
ncbi:MAG: DNA mismatch endonuclease Vsr [Prevotella sp.]|jgi:DNA mismatch endonuclease (patch repair protein)|nr:DNA mismatch endonuclease Vsr [Prevotella sp.]